MPMFNQPNKTEYNVAIFESQSKSAFSEENFLKVLIHFILFNKWTYLPIIKLNNTLNIYYAQTFLTTSSRKTLIQRLIDNCLSN